jgi:hypothetical protein
METEICPECQGECELIGPAPPSKYPSIRKMQEETGIVQDLFRCTQCQTELIRNRQATELASNI